MRLRRILPIGVLLAGVLLALVASAASAEIVIFTSGQTMSIRGHHVEGGAIVLDLPDGGEITCDRVLVSEIRPDEMPPDPVATPAVTTAADPVPYASIIDQVAASQKVDPRLVRAVIAVESAYVPEATSPKGAMGLMQIMPETARAYHVRNPYDPRANIEAGVRHLKVLLQRFSLREALAAYNAGEAAVERFGGIPPFPETQNYVARVLSRLAR